MHLNVYVEHLFNLHALFFTVLSFHFFTYDVIFFRAATASYWGADPGAPVGANEGGTQKASYPIWWRHQMTLNEPWEVHDLSLYALRVWKLKIHSKHVKHPFEEKLISIQKKKRIQGQQKKGVCSRVERKVDGNVRLLQLPFSHVFKYTELFM